jgi:hypothetical protein|tara:strand:- start:1005 stop:1898 length:894 start_codon:yes stop_codon:yes gene_type:complete
MVMGRIKRLYPSKMLSDAREAYASRGASGAAGSIAGSIGSSPFKLLAEGVKRPSSMFWKGLTANKTILGINVGIGSFLKQSQVFTAAVSSILQVVGALVDVFIAPFFIPLILPLIKKMSDQIPKVRAFAQDLAERTIPLIKDRVNAIWQGEGGWISKTARSAKAIASIFWNESGLAEWWETETNPFIVSVKYLFKLIGILVDMVMIPVNTVLDAVENAKEIGEFSKKVVDIGASPLKVAGMSPEEAAEAALSGPFGPNQMNKNLFDRAFGGVLSATQQAMQGVQDLALGALAEDKYR